MGRGRFVMVPHAVLYDTRLSSNARFLLVLLTAHADRGGAAWPGIGRLVDLMQLSRSTVMRALRELRAAELVTTRRRGQAEAVYTLGDEALVPRSHSDTSRNGPRSHSDTSERDRGVKSGGSEVSPRAVRGVKTAPAFLLKELNPGELEPGTNARARARRPHQPPGESDAPTSTPERRCLHPGHGALDPLGRCAACYAAGIERALAEGTISAAYARSALGTAAREG